MPGLIEQLYLLIARSQPVCPKDSAVRAVAAAHMGLELVVQLPSQYPRVIPDGGCDGLRDACSAFTKNRVVGTDVLPGAVTQRNAIGRVVQASRLAVREPNRRGHRGSAEDGLEPVPTQDVEGMVKNAQPDRPVVRFQCRPHKFTYSGHVHAKPAHVCSVCFKSGGIQDFGINSSAIKESAIK